MELSSMCSSHPALAGADKVHVALVGMLVDTHCLLTAVKTLQRMVFLLAKKNGMLVDTHCLPTAVKALQRMVFYWQKKKKKMGCS